MTARLGFGTKLELGDGGDPEVFAEIGEIAEGPDDDESAELVETTNHQSDSSSGKPRREYIGGPVDGGELTLTVNYDRDDATHSRATGLRGMVGATKNFRLTEPGATTRETFSAIIMNAGISRPVADKMSMSVTLKISGAVDTEAVS